MARGSGWRCRCCLHDGTCPDPSEPRRRPAGSRRRRSDHPGGFGARKLTARAVGSAGRRSGLRILFVRRKAGTPPFLVVGGLIRFLRGKEWPRWRLFLRKSSRSETNMSGFTENAARRAQRERAPLAASPTRRSGVRLRTCAGTAARLPRRRSSSGLGGLLDAVPKKGESVLRADQVVAGTFEASVARWQSPPLGFGPLTWDKPMLTFLDEKRLPEMRCWSS